MIAGMHAVPAQCRLERVICLSNCSIRWTRKRPHAVSVTLVDMPTLQVLPNFGASFCCVVMIRGTRMITTGACSMTALGIYSGCHVHILHLPPLCHDVADNGVAKNGSLNFKLIPSGHCVRPLANAYLVSGPSEVGYTTAAACPEMLLCSRSCVSIHEWLEMAHVKSSYDQKRRLGSPLQCAWCCTYKLLIFIASLRS